MHSRGHCICDENREQVRPAEFGQLVACANRVCETQFLPLLLGVVDEVSEQMAAG